MQILGLKGLKHNRESLVIESLRFEDRGDYEDEI